MALIDRGAVDLVEVGVSPHTFGSVRDHIAREFWRWYGEHEDTVVFTRRVLFLNLNVRVRDLHGIFLFIFGMPK